MARDNEFVNYVLEQLSFLHGLHARAMFGGHGLYQDEIFFAIIIDDTLYLKANGATRGDFEAKGLNPFRYTARGKTTTLQYYEAPAEVFEDADEMRFWIGKALEAALAANSEKISKNRRRSGKT